MRRSRNDKEKTSQRIVECAARLIRERGIEAASVVDVMSKAGLTHGGFYRHFEGKDALVLAALEAAFAERLAGLTRRFEDCAPDDAVADYREDYLQDGHVDALGISCPIATLAGDVARASAPLKAAFGTNVRQVIQTLARGMSGSAGKRQAQAVQEIAMLAGALMIARASDPATAKLILAACRGERVAQDQGAE